MNTNQTDKATARPWSWRPSYETSKIYIHSGRTIAEINYHNDVEAHGNAALIVEAVNLHAAYRRTERPARKPMILESETISKLPEPSPVRSSDLLGIRRICNDFRRPKINAEIVRFRLRLTP